MAQAREVALKILYNIDAEAGFANLTLDKELARSGLSRQDKGLVTELVYGTTKYRASLDWVINQFAKTKTPKMSPWIRNILRMGLYQILYLDRIPAAAATNEAVKLARKYGHQGTVSFVNGILRTVIRNQAQIKWPDLDKEPVKYLAVVYSHPEWLVKRWLDRYGLEDTIALCRSNNAPAETWVRCNTLKIQADELKELLLKEGVHVEDSRYVPEGLRIADYGAVEDLAAFQQGYFFIQDEASMLVARALAPKPGSLVIDACSAPGGKTTHIAQLMGNKGQILAFDLHDHKLSLIEDNCRRLGITIVSVQGQDARYLPEELKGQADYVLVDAPCSGTGVLRRRPDARWRKTPEMLQDMPDLQLAILTRAADCLKPGGVLVYSTCSLEPEENRGVIAKFRAEHPEFATESLLPYIDRGLSDEDREQAATGSIQFLPQVHQTDGFFIARLTRL